MDSEAADTDQKARRPVLFRMACWEDMKLSAFATMH
jgi:hypothetical protein